MLYASDVRAYYRRSPLEVPPFWNLSRKHVRIVLYNGRFLKMNRFRNRLSVRDLRYLCVKYAPVHVYFSVLDWLFPERVGRKYKANHALPLGGQYIFDVDSHNVWASHNHHNRGAVCPGCLHNAKFFTIHVCEAIEQNHSNLMIVFSARKGFHIHVLDFNLRDWTYYNERNPIKSQEVARFRYTRLLAGFLPVNRPHFLLSTDPMRIISVPYSLNAETGLVCVPVGNRKTLERLTIEEIIKMASPYSHNLLDQSALDLYNAHPEPWKSTLRAWC
ncbi:MAG: hypothetical protein OEZ48_00505 [Candidatus Bathyarchaeota archaeon]|nr:hypothetical protein [Candidatus Bathyarchaeota archaeon]